MRHKNNGVISKIRNRCGSSSRIGVMYSFVFYSFALTFNQALAWPVLVIVHATLVNGLACCLKDV